MVVQSSSNATRGELACDFDAASGQGALPGSLLAQLPTGTPYGNLNAQIRGTASVDSGLAHVELDVVRPAGNWGVDLH